VLFMNRLMTSETWMSRADLNSDPLVGGSVSAIKKTLQRLEARGVVEVKEEKASQGLPLKLYRVLLAHAQGESQEGGQPPQTPSENRASERGHGTVKEVKSEDCPLSESSTGAPSDAADDVSLYSRARSEEELNSTLDQSVWD